MSEYVPRLKPCNVENCSHPRKVHEVVFFIALYFLSLGSGGHKPSLESFGADQFDENHVEERKQKMSFFNWWNFALWSGFVLSAIFLVYVQDHVGWGIANLILTLTMCGAFILFCLGKPFYRYMVPKGSPIMPMLQVLVAAMVKRSLPHPSNPDFLYEIPESHKIQGRLLCHTNNLRYARKNKINCFLFRCLPVAKFLVFNFILLHLACRFLDKAAIVETYDVQSQEMKQIPRRLVTVTMVEETKLIINMLPIWFTSLIFGICLAQASTFFVKQSGTMNRKIGSKFEIPPATVGFLSATATLLAITLYEKILIPLLRRATGNERGINVLQRIGIGMIFPILAMAIAALVERRRLRLAERELAQGKTGQSLPMSVFWLAPQYIILGIGDSFSLVGLQEYFYEQVPDSMRSLGMAFFLSVIGVGSFISSFLITIVEHITEKFGTSWFGEDLNSSSVDKFYWLMTAMSSLNLCMYVFFAKRYSYKSVKRNVMVADCQEGDSREPMA